MREIMDIINEAQDEAEPKPMVLKLGGAMRTVDTDGPERTENDDGSVTIRMPKREEECPAVDFLKAVWEATTPHPFMRGARIWGGMIIELMRDIDDPNTSVYLKNIDSMEPGKGEASELLKGLCGMADSMKVTLTLTAKAYGSREGIMKTKQLVAWYGRNGFRQSGRGSAYDGFYMVRKPR